MFNNIVNKKFKNNPGSHHPYDFQTMTSLAGELGKDLAESLRSFPVLPLGAISECLEMPVHWKSVDSIRWVSSRCGRG
jgi:hypothetical protein